MCPTTRGVRQLALALPGTPKPFALSCARCAAMAAATDDSAVVAALPLQQRRGAAQPTEAPGSAPTPMAKAAASTPDSKSVPGPWVTSPSSETPKVLYPGTPSPIQMLYADALYANAGSACPSFGVPMQELRSTGVYAATAPQAQMPPAQVMYAHQPAVPLAMDGATTAMPNTAVLPQLDGQASDVPNAMVGVQPALVVGAFPSAGSSLHDGAGSCSPCAWFWKPRGCQSGAACGYCHLCPEGELKSRKKAKVAAIRTGALNPSVRGQSCGEWQLGSRTSLQLTTLL